MTADREVVRREANGATVIVLEGDLTTQQVDVVVNAANEQLAHGGGVAAALAHAGGPQVQRESDAWVAEHGPVKPGTAAVTTAGNMAARWIVHVVGPRWRQSQDNEGLLRQAVRAALDAARDLGATSIALPAVSAGIFGYPRNEATAIIVDETNQWLASDRGGLSEIRLVGYDAATAQDCSRMRLNHRFMRRRRHLTVVARRLLGAPRRRRCRRRRSP
jgi:O-acetyl-ADP-ribose deacetylase